jgi:hypothetical protein
MPINTEQNETAYMKALEEDLGVDPQTLVPPAAQIRTPFDRIEALISQSIEFDREQMANTQ